MLIKDVMTRGPICCNASDTLDTVAKLMRDYDCGAIPVCNGPTLVGLITDRDITCRAVAAGSMPSALRARDVMTDTVVVARETDTVDESIRRMQEKLVRRLPVVDADGNVVGIVSEADLVARVSTLGVARLVKAVSRRTRGHARAAS
jgi:CBS domain-containing protein